MFPQISIALKDFRCTHARMNFQSISRRPSLEMNSANYYVCTIAAINMSHQKTCVLLGTIHWLLLLIIQATSPSAIISRLFFYFHLPSYICYVYASSLSSPMLPSSFGRTKDNHWHYHSDSSGYPHEPPLSHNRTSMVLLYIANVSPDSWAIHIPAHS